jgi:hypothetical protein
VQQTVMRSSVFRCIRCILDDDDDGDDDDVVMMVMMMMMIDASEMH